MTEECQGIPPAPQHEKLMESAGEWDVSARFYMDPSQPPVETSATDSISAVGSFWVVGDYNGDFMGMPFRGVSQVGWDPRIQKYVSTWIDAMSPFMYRFEGDWDGGMLKMEGMNPNPMTGEDCKWRIEEEHPDRDNRTMRMYVEMGGQEVQTFEMTYKRKS